MIRRLAAASALVALAVIGFASTASAAPVTELVNEPTTKVVSVESDGTGLSASLLVNEIGQSGGGVTAWTPQGVVTVGFDFSGKPIFGFGQR